MPYDPGQHYTATSDGRGGVRLRFHDDLGTRTRDLDASFLPGSGQSRDGEQEELDQNRPKIVARFPDPGPDRHYELTPAGDGAEWIVCLVSGPDPDAENGETIGDRSRIHRLHFPNGDQSLKAMNARNRRHWSRDKQTLDKENTMFRHGPLLEGERLELRGPDRFGMFDLVLVSADQPDIAPRENVGRAGASRSVTGDKGYARGSTSDRLAKMNTAAFEFWRRK